MIHSRKDYNRIQDPENKIPEDEPVFLLRAQDRSSADTIRYWAMRQTGESIAKLAFEQADLMDKWPVKKSADL